MCAILDDGTVSCWGRNNFGQVGDGTLSAKSTPVPVSGLGTAISIAAGSFHTCAILITGTASCWGFNDSGQLGNGTTTNSSVPVAVSGLTNVVSLAAGFLHTCAVRVDGTVWCWGAAEANGSTIMMSKPTKANISAAVAVTAGAGHTCAVVADGTARCWGQNTYGQLGTGDNNPTHIPTKVLTSFKGQLRAVDGVVAVLAGGNFTCARQTGGGASCWGDNSFGQFGNETVVGGSLAVLAQPRNSAAVRRVAFAAGGAHACGILEDGSVSCAGQNDAMQLGHRNSGSEDFSVFSSLVPGVGNAVEIVAGNKHTCAAIVDGTLRCWGDNNYGQHGDGISGQVGTDSVIGIVGTFLGRGVAAGNQFPCGRRGTGAAACWGAGDAGQLGDSARVSSLNPVAVTGLTNAIAVTAGGTHACAIDGTGRARCWGSNARGQLGNGTTTPANQPVFVDFEHAFLPISTLIAIAASSDHTCGIAIDSAVYCWGAGDQLGDSADESLPAEIAFSSRAVAIAAGTAFTCALIADGTVDCIGDNSAGQLGNGGAPAQPGLLNLVPGLFNVVGVAAGADHACAVTAFGSVLCWGGNSRGQIGNNSTTAAPFPTTVQGITDAVSVSAGAFYTCAVRANGTASCWGANDAGELGVKDAGDHLTPTAVAASVISLPTGGTTFIALTGVVAIATGSSPLSPTHEQTCALLATGVVRCWGDNARGEIGDGTTVNQPRPTAVNSFAANVDPAAALHNEHVAIVTALVTCDIGDEAHIDVTVEQNGATGSAHDSARCDGRLLRVPMRVVVHGRANFQTGAATAHLEAVVHRGREVVDDTHWTRAIVLSTEHR
jgi:alpha-tubulin suppressor-like RCC1 family protein